MATDEESGRGLSAYTRSILRAAVVDIVAAALTAAVGAFALLVGLLIWQGGTVPAWLAALFLVIVLAGALRAHLQTRELRTEVAELNGHIAVLEPEVDRIPELGSRQTSSDFSAGSTATRHTAATSRECSTSYSESLRGSWRSLSPTSSAGESFSPPATCS